MSVQFVLIESLSGKETTFEGNVVDKAQVWQTLLSIAERLEVILESKNVLAKTITLKVKYSDFQLNTRSKTQALGMRSKQQMINILPELLQKTEVGKRPIRLIGITLSNLLKVNDSRDEVSTEGITKDTQLGLF